jgi:hypothetical protein
MPRSGSSAYLSPEVVAFLSERGAKPDRGRGPLNQSVLLRRHLDFYEHMLEHSDPRQTSAFPEPYYQLTIELLLGDPWSIRAQDIASLDAYLTRLPSFGELASRYRVDAAECAKAVAGLSYNERLFLVNEAEMRHARPAADEGV